MRSSLSWKLAVTDGPYTEAKEVIGGYALVETRSKEEAIEVATTFMDIHRRHWPEFDGACEVRGLDAEECATPADAAMSEDASSVN
jgi:hypothetical protein